MALPVPQVPSKCPRVAEVIEKALPFTDETQRQWWRDTGILFARFLQAGDYDLHEQYQHLLFLYRTIMPTLGPYPPRYKTFQNRSCVPVEYSLNFQSDNTKLLLRISLEPVNYLSGTETDRCNQIPVRKLISQLAELGLPGFDSALSDHFIGQFFLSEDEVRSLPTKGARMDSVRTHVLFGFDLKADAVCLHQGIHCHEVEKPLDRDPGCRAHCRCVKSNGYDMRAWVAWDNVTMHQSRLKFYGVSNEVALAKVKDVWTLGDRLEDTTTTRGWELINRLWALLGMRDTVTSFTNGYDDEDDNNEAAVTPSPLMWNYEVKSGWDRPRPKIYFPVHGENDLKVARGVAAFFASIGWKRQAAAYEGLLRSLYPESDISQTSRLQSWISFAYSDDGTVYSTIYYPSTISYPWSN